MIPPASSMWRSWLIVGCLILICTVVAWRTGGPQRIGQALGSGAELFVGVLPNLILGFTLAGFIHVLIPDELIGRWLGHETGVRGLLIGTGLGMLTPGGPFTHFPILASFLAKGASVGPICAYIAAWGMVGISRLVVWELPLLGSQVVLARVIASIGFPPLIGWISGWLFRLFRYPA